MDIVVLEDTPPTSEEVNSALETAKYLVVAKCRITFAGDPDSSIRVGKYLVLYELATSLEV